MGTVLSLERPGARRGRSAAVRLERIPVYVLVKTCPEETEGEGESQFLERDTGNQNSRERAKIPNLRHISRKKGVERQEIEEVEPQEQKRARDKFLPEVRAAQSDGDASAGKRDHRRVDGVQFARCVEDREDERSGKQGKRVKTVAGRVMCSSRQRAMARRKEPLESHRGQAAGAPGKDDAFEIKTSASGKVEKRGRIPIFGNEQGFGEAEERRPNTYEEHLLSAHAPPR